MVLIEYINYITVIDLKQLTGMYSSYPANVMLNVRGYAKQLKGTTGKSLFTGRTYYAFRSIHYAEKPTNLTRFLVFQ